MNRARFSLHPDPSRVDAYCTPGDHRILNIREGRCEWCGLALLALCPECVGAIGGACGGPDAPYRPAKPGEPCGAADCQGAPPLKHDAEHTDGPTGAAANGWDLPWDESEDEDDDEPDAYEVWNATGEFPK